MDFNLHASESNDHFQRWYDESGAYRLTWRDQFMGVKVPESVYAEVKIENQNGEHVWTFAGRRGPYKSTSRATVDCKRHRKAWERILRLARGRPLGRTERLREFEIKSRGYTGKRNKAKRYKIMSDLPVWVRQTGDARCVSRILRAIAPHYIQKEREERELDGHIL